MHLHRAQEPPPPQAEARKSSLLASVCNSLSPAGTHRVRSPLISILTSPLLTSMERATRMTPTSARISTANIATPRPMSFILKLTAEEVLDSERLSHVRGRAYRMVS